MPFTVLEKLSFCGALAVLFLQHRVGAPMVPALVADSTLGVLFVASYRKTPPTA